MNNLAMVKLLDEYDALKQEAKALEARMSEIKEELTPMLDSPQMIVISGGRRLQVTEVRKFNPALAVEKLPEDLLAQISVPVPQLSLAKQHLTGAELDELKTTSLQWNFRTNN